MARYFCIRIVEPAAVEEGVTFTDMAEPSRLRANQGIKANGASFGQKATLLWRVLEPNMA